GLVDEIVRLEDKYVRAVAWIHDVNRLPSYGELKNWTPKDEPKTFKKLWMNPRHKETVEKHGKRPKK
ncbi:MAG TPA: hypothetical protein VFV50_09795, partial [Bdellovibrionales bacterium]|nr:hypothetical protein [Bdellovibrionales bacterium]